MSYYKYLNRYSLSFLRKYQTEEYAALGRASHYAEIVNMNAVSSLSVDEDISLRWKVPFTLAGLLGFSTLIYWWIYHFETFLGNEVRTRLRSYHNFKMWSRLEITLNKNNLEKRDLIGEALRERWYRAYNITPDEFAAFRAKCAEGKDPNEALAEIGLRWDKTHNVMVKLE